MELSSLVASLRAEARRANERRLLVFAGERDAGFDAAFAALEAADVPDDEATVVTTREGFRLERVHPKRAGDLLGTTRTAVVVDAHAEFSPNGLGQVVGTVDGGGLLIVLAPPLDDWPDRRDGFDESLAVPPYALDDVTGHFRRRLVETLRAHPGIAVVDVDDDRVERDGLTDAVEAPATQPIHIPADRAIPAKAYESCFTADQARAVRALERLRERGRAVVVEADRGRGKSSAAGLAAGALAAEGRDVLVTAPGYRNAREVFLRGRELLAALGALDEVSDGDSPRRLTAASGGTVRFVDPPAAVDALDDPDVVLVDEAAALPVSLLTQFLSAPSVGFLTTVHGYEGAGRGFSVRFRDRLEESDLDVTEVRLADPIRYAGGDPVETWAFRALLLDARPAVDQLVGDATPTAATYRALSPADLLADEHLLREVFGLLVLAHYRTEPNDLARLLDAPNLRLRALLYDGHVVSVALLAREGDLDAETRRSMYDGARVRGNMLPDVLTSQLRDEEAGGPAGYRVMRIATHHAARSRGLGSRLLDEVATEFDDAVDWLGAGYGATPELLRFWRRNGYRTVHLSTTRNETSGEYSALMLRPTSGDGRELAERQGRRFRERAADVLADPLRDVDPDVARAALRSTDGVPAPDLSEYEWRVVAGAAYGPGLYVTAPGAFRELALAHLCEGEADLPARAERLLVRKVLQCHPWNVVAEELGHVSTRRCMKALGDAYKPLVDRYGTEAALDEKRRYTD